MESAEIEGADVDFNAVFRTDTQTRNQIAMDYSSSHSEGQDQTKDTQEVLNYEAALQTGIEKLEDGGEITLELLHTLHETLLTDVPSERRETETLGDFKQVPNRAGTFLTPPPDRVGGMVDALVTYLRTGGRYHAIVDTALVHYQFETIHPYGDGNGRMGRLLITLQLYAAGYLEDPILYLSEYFNRNKQTYVDRMDAVRTDGQWEAWIEFFVEGVKNQAKEAVYRAQDLSKLEEEYKQTYEGRSTATARLARNLFEIPYFTANDVAAFLDVQPSTAYRAIDSLQEAGLLEEVTDKDRYREYRAREIFEILEQPPQTY